MGLKIEFSLKNFGVPLKSFFVCVSGFIFNKAVFSSSGAAGFLRDRLGNYDVAFYLAGIPPIFGGAVLCLIPWVEARRRRAKKEGQAKEQDVTQAMLEHGKAQEDVQQKTGESVL